MKDTAADSETEPITVAVSLKTRSTVRENAAETDGKKKQWRNRRQRSKRSTISKVS